MYRRGNKSKIITSLVLVAVLTISIGYAAFSNTLRITPQATITPDSATFDIDFSSSNSGVVANDITPTLTGTGLTAEAAEIDNTTNPTISNLTVNFTKPGQRATYSFYAYNNGEYLAYLTSVNFINPEGKDAFITCEAVEDTTQYVSDACAGIKVNIQVGSLTTDVTKEGIRSHSLAKQTAEEVIVTIEYAEGSAVADGTFTANIGDITLIYTTLDTQQLTAYYAFGLPTTSSSTNYQDVISSSGSNTFVKLEGEQLSLCIYKNQTLECFKNNNFAEESVHLQNVFGVDNCDESGCFSDGLGCSIDGNSVGCTDVDNQLRCSVEFNNSVYCGGV